MRRSFDLWSLLAIYVAAGTMMVEATYDLPLALLDEWGRLIRA